VGGPSEGGEQASASSAPATVRQGFPPAGIKIVRKLPRTSAEVQAIHEQVEGDACETIPAGEPVDLSGFRPYLTPSDRLLGGEKPPLMTRMHAFSVGIDFLEKDRRDLPFLSGGEILKFFHGSYVMLQIRVQRDPRTQSLYLHHRPLGGMTSFTGPRVAANLTTGVAASLANYRSLGLLLKPEVTPSCENLRTLVVLHKSEVLPLAAESVDDIEHHYEFVFVRAVSEGQGDSERLALHSFVTSGDRTELHYLRPSRTPAGPDTCSVRTMICFTEYSHAGLRPKSSATRTRLFNDQASYSMADLNAFARQQEWTGDALDNLTETLDAIIAGDL
jgi:hypothetical protein